MKLRFALLGLHSSAALDWAAELRAGIIGADTLHVVAFTCGR